MNVKHEDLRILLLCTFRYSLGRRTYMPGYAVEMVQRYGKVLYSWDWRQMTREISNAVSLGDDCDKATWLGFRAYCLEVEVRASQSEAERPKARGIVPKRECKK